MIVTIFAALMLQTSPLQPAHCMLNNGPVVPCHVMVRREEGYVGAAFRLAGSSLVFGGNKQDARTSDVRVFTINRTSIAATGLCMFKAEERVVGCTVNLDGQTVTVVAQLD